jgi:hypothetical protein
LGMYVNFQTETRIPSAHLAGYKFLPRKEILTTGRRSRRN